MSIVDPDYRDRYRGAGDWFTNLLNATCYSPIMKEVEKTQSDGTIAKVHVPTRRKKFDTDIFFSLAIENGIEEERLFKYRQIVGQRASEGRIRMSVGNMLRATARKNGGLKMFGEFHEAPDDFLNKPQSREAA